MWSLINKTNFQFQIWLELESCWSTLNFLKMLIINETKNWSIYKGNRRENNNKKNLQKKGKLLLHQSIISSNLYFQIIQKKIIYWKSNSSKYFLSYIDQIFDTLLVWAYCILLLFERAIIVYNKLFVKVWSSPVRRLGTVWSSPQRRLSN